MLTTNAPRAPGASNGAADRGAADDLRLATIVRLLSDHQNAPNLWLARRIVEALDNEADDAGQDDARASTPHHNPARSRPS
jgi:hypothetical protein